MTIAEIKKQMTDSFMQNSTIAAVYKFNSLSFEDEFSNVSFENIVFSIVAFCWWSLSKLFDLHKTENQTLIKNQKNFRLPWYAEMAKKFQYGYNLVPDQDYYDNTGIPDATIEASKIIKFAAAEELLLGIRLKLATLSGDDLAPVPEPQLSAFKAYMERVKPAGVNLEDYYINTTSDSLKLTLRIAYNPLVLDATGKRLDGTDDTPVQAAIDDYLKNKIEFNGLFKPMRLVDNVQVVDGIDNVEIVSVEARYGANPFAPVGLKYQPYAGYLWFLNPSDLTILYEPA